MLELEVGQHTRDIRRLKDQVVLLEDGQVGAALREAELAEKVRLLEVQLQMQTEEIEVLKARLDDLNSRVANVGRTR